VCGRYTLAVPVGELVQLFQVDRNAVEDLAPRFNVAPGQEAPVVLADGDGRRHMGLLRWGLIPSWADDPGVGSRMINARSETVDTRPAFREAFRTRRCLIPVDGFYEWRKGVGSEPSRPFHFHLPDGGVMALAGLWERWTDSAGGRVGTFTILTRATPPRFSGIHHRMPVIVPPGSWGAWLGRSTPVQVAQTIAREGLVDTVEAWEVSRAVNSPGVDSAECREPVPDGEVIPQGSGGVVDP
jgi:putative SOS response-associated peptidase YedK